MTTTYRKIAAAVKALQPLMMVKGFTGRTQLLLMRLWNELEPHNKTLGESEVAAIRAAGGVIGEKDTITFPDAEAKAEFLAKHEDMLAVEAEIKPIQLKPEPALFAASTPETWAALDGFIIIEGSENA